jgi:hypothetical protein
MTQFLCCVLDVRLRPLVPLLLGVVLFWSEHNRYEGETKSVRFPANSSIVPIRERYRRRIGSFLGVAIGYAFGLCCGYVGNEL